MYFTEEERRIFKEHGISPNMALLRLIEAVNALEAQGKVMKLKDIELEQRLSACEGAIFPSDVDVAPCLQIRVDRLEAQGKEDRDYVYTELSKIEARIYAKLAALEKRMEALDCAPKKKGCVHNPAPYPDGYCWNCEGDHPHEGCTDLPRPCPKWREKTEPVCETCVQDEADRTPSLACKGCPSCPPAKSCADDCGEYDDCKWRNKGMWQDKNCPYKTPKPAKEEGEKAHQPAPLKPQITQVDKMFSEVTHNGQLTPPPKPQGEAWLRVKLDEKGNVYLHSVSELAQKQISSGALKMSMMIINESYVNPADLVQNPGEAE